MVRSRKKFTSPRLTRRRRRVFVRKCLILGGTLAVLFGLSVAAFRVPWLQIANVEVLGASTISSEALSGMVQKGLEGNYAHLFPKSNNLLYPRETILKGVLQEYPRIANADLSLSDINALRLVVSERSPYALWCGEKRQSGEMGSCYFLDESGYIFGKAPDFNGSVFFEFYGATSGTEVLGAQFLPPEEFKKLAAFADSLRGSTGMPKPNAVVVQKDNDVTIYLDNGRRIFVTRNADFAEARVNLESVLDSSEFKERTPGKFDYIDLRFGNKVYFK